MAEQNQISREELEARLDAMTSRVEASEARINGSLEKIGVQIEALAGSIDARVLAAVGPLQTKLEALDLDLKNKPGTLQQLGIVFGAVATGLAVVLAMLAFAGDRFDGGMALATSVSADAFEARSIAEDSAKKIDTLLDVITIQQQELQSRETAVEQLPQPE